MESQLKNRTKVFVASRKTAEQNLVSEDKILYNHQ
jgi:hypothetical protein